MTHLPDVLVRINKQATLTACFVQGDELADIISAVRVAWGEFARRSSILPQADVDEIDLAMARVVELYCAAAGIISDPRGGYERLQD